MNTLLNENSDGISEEIREMMEKDREWYLYRENYPVIPVEEIKFGEFWSTKEKYVLPDGTLRETYSPLIYDVIILSGIKHSQLTKTPYVEAAIVKHFPITSTELDYILEEGVFPYQGKSIIKFDLIYMLPIVNLEKRIGKIEDNDLLNKIEKAYRYTLDSEGYDPGEELPWGGENVILSISPEVQDILLFASGAEDTQYLDEQTSAIDEEFIIEETFNNRITIINHKLKNEILKNFREAFNNLFSPRSKEKTNISLISPHNLEFVFGTDNPTTCENDVFVSKEAGLGLIGSIFCDGIQMPRVELTGEKINQIKKISLNLTNTSPDNLKEEKDPITHVEIKTIKQYEDFIYFDFEKDVFQKIPTHEIQLEIELIDTSKIIIDFKTMLLNNG